MRLRRHDLLDVAPGAWQAAVAGLDLPRDAARVVADWSSLRRPVIVRRRLAGDPAGTVPVALQLPNAQGRLRLALAVPERSVTHRVPVTLAIAAQAAPARWRETIAVLLTLGDMFGDPAVFGGLLWQYLTAKPVLRPTSDLDLLWSPVATDRGRLVDALDRLDMSAVRIDGEIEFGTGAVSWRELRSAMAGHTSTLVVKTIDGVELRDAACIIEDEGPRC